MLDEFTARNNSSLTSLLDEYETKLRPLPDDVMDILHSNAVIALDKLKEDDPMAAKISASYEDFSMVYALPRNFRARVLERERPSATADLVY